MIYGNKVFSLVFLLFLFFFIGCTQFKNFSYQLYDGSVIRGYESKIQLYKDEDVILIGDENYKIEEFKYNSDVVCLKLTNGKYYMIYYFDSSVYGPYTKDSLDETTNSYSMTFSNDFQNILKADVIYE